jgi:hypothetical protein
VSTARPAERVGSDSCAAMPSMTCAGTYPPPLGSTGGNRTCGRYAGMPRFFPFAGRSTSGTCRTAWSTAHSTCRFGLHGLVPRVSAATSLNTRYRRRVQGKFGVTKVVSLDRQAATQYENGAMAVHRL